MCTPQPSRGQVGLSSATDSHEIELNGFCAPWSGHVGPEMQYACRRLTQVDVLWGPLNTDLLQPFAVVVMARGLCLR